MSEQLQCPHGISGPSSTNVISGPVEICTCCRNCYHVMPTGDSSLCATCQICPHMNIEPQLVCERCGHRESMGDLADLLTDIAQVFDGWHADGTAWSEWDESVRKRLSVAMEGMRR